MLVCIAILKFDVICMHLTEVRVEYQQLFVNGVARDKIVSDTVARILNAVVDQLHTAVLLGYSHQYVGPLVNARNHYFKSNKTKSS